MKRSDRFRAADQFKKRKYVSYYPYFVHFDGSRPHYLSVARNPLDEKYGDVWKLPIDVSILTLEVLVLKRWLVLVKELKRRKEYSKKMPYLNIKGLVQLEPYIKHALKKSKDLLRFACNEQNGQACSACKKAFEKALPKFHKPLITACEVLDHRRSIYWWHYAHLFIQSHEYSMRYTMKHLLRSTFSESSKQIAESFVEILSLPDTVIKVMSVNHSKAQESRDLVKGKQGKVSCVTVLPQKYPMSEKNFSKGQMWGALRKTWKAYKIAMARKDYPNVIRYAERIRTLQDKLDVKQTFRCVLMECLQAIKSEPDKAEEWLRSLPEHDFEFVKDFIMRAEERIDQ